MIFLQRAREREIVICIANGSSKFSIITSPPHWPMRPQRLHGKYDFSLSFLLLISENSFSGDGSSGDPPSPNFKLAALQPSCVWHSGRVNHATVVNTLKMIGQHVSLWIARQPLDSALSYVFFITVLGGEEQGQRILGVRICLFCLLNFLASLGQDLSILPVKLFGQSWLRFAYFAC